MVVNATLDAVCDLVVQHREEEEKEEGKDEEQI